MGWNPIYLEYESANMGLKPSFGVRLECLGEGCINAECTINPAVHGVNAMSGLTTTADGDAKGPGHVSCVSSIPSGVQVDVVFFMA